MILDNTFEYIQNKGWITEQDCDVDVYCPRHQGA